jgi:3-deoxy-7-phosphoheptulonate synthase
MLPLENLNVAGTQALPTPAQVHEGLPVTERAAATVLSGRRTIEAILTGADPRLFAVVGPCSIHDPDAALDYASRLRALAERIQDRIFIVMRVYFEKPRTTVGWKGLINDPDMDDSFHIERGLATARRLLLALNEIGLACGTEALDPISPQYLGDLVSWNAIGARTTESQTHREMSSGLSTSVGFKNGTDGNLAVAVNAMLSAASPHAFLGVDGAGRVAVVRTRGNRLGHLILRGGAQPNHDAASVDLACRTLREAGLAERIVIDCSHGNSSKDPSRQPQVLADVLAQVAAGRTAIRGVMLESNLFEGSQKITDARRGLRYGVSVTDGCIGWETTEAALLQAAEQLRAVGVSA